MLSFNKSLTIGTSDWKTAPFRFYGKNEMWSIGGGKVEPTWQDIILSGNTALTLINSKANGLNYLKLFGKCEQKSVLPDEFQRVEYLETDGNQYIDTGVLLNNIDEFEITFQSSKDALTTPVMGAISGGTSYTSNNNISVTYNVGSNVNAYSIYNNGAAGSPNFAWNGGDYADKLKHTIKYTGLDTAPTIDGEAMTQITSHTISVSDASVTTWLFGRSNTGTGTKAQDGIRIYDANFYSKGHFIPCRRKSDSVLGVYDTVTGTFLTNAGTGEFTAGANVTIPTPDNIMPIWCNNGEIKYGFGQNLIDNTIDGQGTYATQSASTANRIFKAFGNISTGKYKVTISNGYEFIVQYRNTGGGSGNIGTWNTSGEYDLDNLDYSYGIAIRYPDNSAITPEDFNGTLSLQIQGIYTDGTQETISVTGKNLFDSTMVTIGYRLNDDGTIASSAPVFVSRFISVKPNTTYTFSYISGESNQYRRICGYNAETSESFTDLIIKINNSGGGSVGEYKTNSFTTDANTNYIRVATFNTDTQVQIELGSTATAYEPYYNGGTATAPALFAVGDYKDEFILEN